MSQEEIIRELEDARDAITAAYERRRELVLKAREAGVPVTRIAKALGLSRERVYKIARNL
ncbi:helix-turn-helix domain-containing protein [Corynebacterium otitidis]|uniref:helix-turn-helix domain-containing protein n=1 Tax=Corynebacterium otitidis TaxID=29321 RepID=UPI00062819EC|nr:helix-turn-helix domain-containing protein [Corynebacterium otitidis]KKO84482.1 hypothetical protein AAV33_00720 [Corynebacterium otitidis]